MAIKTSDEAKELFDKAMDLSDEDIMILKEMSATAATPPLKLATQLLVSPNAAYDRLSQLQERGLVTKVEPTHYYFFASEEEEYFALSDEGEEMITILPLVEKVRGAP